MKEDMKEERKENEKPILEKEIHMNTVNFEKCFIAMQYLFEPLKEGKKMRIIIDYDPQKERTELRYFKVEE